MRVAIFGTVGAGKTTLIENIHSFLPNYVTFWEPLEKNPYFSQLYSNNKDIRAITYKMEIWMLAARMKQLKQSSDQKDVLFDRGVMDTIIFADTNYQLEKLDARDWQVYSDYFQIATIPSLFNHQDPAYDLVIYLKVDSQVSIERIRARGIESEQNVDPMFWNILNQTYDKWYEKLKDCVPFLVINGNNNDSKVLAQQVVETIKQQQKQ
ncbi:Deoxyadenosine/deoxycytidine kinase [Mesoplasma sp. JKS002658]|uniref:deoxynucleoside kinase n=1 Tax=Mesoplasma whartonense TaxID=2878854 RepID=UPI0020229D9B|nr:MULTISPECIES: deoxynucleoside kinase [unclassified Mesoplasma]MCL8211223.1 Deoxyadenosine/deoxycytidine kinase [Mesoplasma sp. JKS002664]MCL8211884.1 Deoxyadenosine/deoxycytidine kinase [Mesoplasma sp. JKS002662]MCL8212885.1 Deoxyadenosine/deoxycytidine kinase [Mesoplasma sp. JKS002661]MCL8214011.1 Deoxyadenosine/deoxycytidine kinase [Mesoplasma sp. JKS002658]MCL8214561.1 Deoxyadenosine/deoxycytidine kinase [Mesoplasma sp. JKS002663]